MKTNDSCRFLAAKRFAPGYSIFGPAITPICITICRPRHFSCLQGKASVKGIKRRGAHHRKNEIVFFGAKDYYQITNVGTEPLVLVGNRSEAFGGAHVTAKE